MYIQTGLLFHLKYCMGEGVGGVLGWEIIKIVMGWGKR